MAKRISERPGWRNIDAMLLPAGFFKLSGWWGPLTDDDRRRRIDVTSAARVCTRAAGLLSSHSPGCVVAAGFDTHAHGDWRGDMMMAAFNEDGALGVTRMIYPVRGDNTLVFPADADTPGRIVELPNGRTAMLCVCYDGFVLAELATGPFGKRGNIGFLAAGRSRSRTPSADDVGDLLGRLCAQLQSAEPSVVLVGIHSFKRPGGELLWQRHGIATASAALEGALAVGASHFKRVLPDLTQSPLASVGVSREHLDLGCHRPARELKPKRGFEVRLPSNPKKRALVRLYEA